MGPYPRPVERLIGLLSSLPGLGPKSAQRIALFLLGQTQEFSLELARCIQELKERVFLCSQCFNLTEVDPCPVCRDPLRDRSLVMVVESPGDQFAVEEAGIYKGLYHVLHGTIAPLDKIGPEDLKISELINRVKEGSIKELIIALNPTPAGEATASYITHMVSKEVPSIIVTRLAVGLPMGGDLKYIDRLTLEHSIKGRRAI